MVLFAEYTFPGTFEDHAPLCPRFPAPRAVSASLIRTPFMDPLSLGSATDHTLVTAAELPSLDLHSSQMWGGIARETRET